MEQLVHANKAQRKQAVPKQATRTSMLELAQTALLDSDYSYAVIDTRATVDSDTLVLVSNDCDEVSSKLEESAFYVTIWHPALAAAYIPVEETLTVTEAKI